MSNGRQIMIAKVSQSLQDCGWPAAVAARKALAFARCNAPVTLSEVRSTTMLPLAFGL